MQAKTNVKLEKKKPTKVLINASHPTITARASKPQTVRSDGYIEVPKEIWTKAGFKAGKPFVLVVHPNSLNIYHMSKRSKYNGRFASFVGEPKNTLGVVPPAGRFRLTNEQLSLAGLKEDEIAFHQYTDKIVVCKKI